MGVSFTCFKREPYDTDRLDYKILNHDLNPTYSSGAVGDYNEVWWPLIMLLSCFCWCIVIVVVLLLFLLLQYCYCCSIAVGFVVAVLLLLLCIAVVVELLLLQYCCCYCISMAITLHQFIFRVLIYWFTVSIICFILVLIIHLWFNMFIFHWSINYSSDKCFLVSTRLPWLYDINNIFKNHIIQSV